MAKKTLALEKNNLLNTLHCGDCLEFMRTIPDDTFDLVITSPPYEDCRTYDIGFKFSGQDYVDWAVERFVECVRVSKGLVAWVIEGKTRNRRWSATPALVMADLHRRGVNLRKPPIFHRVGVPGSGGRKAEHEAAGGSADWLRNDYEFVICATSGGKLPWADTLVMGHPPKWAPGGAMSNRLQDGTRVIEKTQTRRKADGSRPRDGVYKMPEKANPGNVIQEKYTADEVAAMLPQAGDVTHHNVGGGVMGSPLAHENEAPFPETLAEFYIRSFSRPGGLVFEPFCGSGTVPAVCMKNGRNYCGVDVRQSQIDITKRRIDDVTKVMTAA